MYLCLVRSFCDVFIEGSLVGIFRAINAYSSQVALRQSLQLELDWGRRPKGHVTSVP
jgi:hypothetical protein